MDSSCDEYRCPCHYELEKVRALPNLFQLGDVTLASGAKSHFKLECDALTDKDWECLAAMMAKVVGPFSQVVGVPRGGLKLADKLLVYQMARMSGPTLIVDDVLTTGGSMTRTLLERFDATDIVAGKVKGAVVFARGICPYWVTPLFQMPPSLFLSGDPRGPQTPLPK